LAASGERLQGYHPGESHRANAVALQLNCRSRGWNPGSFRLMRGCAYRNDQRFRQKLGAVGSAA